MSEIDGADDTPLEQPDVGTEVHAPARARVRSAGRGRGGAAARRAARADTSVAQLPYIRRKISTFDILDDEAMQIIENNADTVLEEIGVAFRDDAEALSMWKEAGADVKGERVHFPKGLCRALMKTAPQQFTQHARNADRNVEIGGNNTVFAPVYGPPFVRGLDGERRYGTIEDFQNLVKMAYMAPAMHHSGGTICEPSDIPVNKRHLDMLLAHMSLSDKPYMGSVTAPERAQDTVEMSKILFSDDFVDNNCVVTSLININSPLVMDDTMLGALKVYARAGQACIISPFIVGGAMSPVTVAGTLTQVLAEAQAALAFSQLCRPGAPVIFGTFATSISMQTGAPAFGTPEPSQVLYGAAQFARKYKLPFRSGGSLTGAKMPDAQAAYDSANTLNATLLGGVNFSLHAAGWLEGGLVSSFEKFVMDCDQLAAQQKMAEGVAVDENGQAMDAIREIIEKEQTHYLGTEHTQNNFKTAFYASTVADNNSFEQWEAEGSKWANERARATAEQWIKNHQAPTMDEGKREALEVFVAQKKDSMPDAFT
ncbi:MAG: trimethylamine methyltransferase family protein [Altererythrobacter sp.]|nr:trimethylamine methyltransferase family protein [Altererythrobacter sp.]